MRRQELAVEEERVLLVAPRGRMKASSLVGEASARPRDQSVLWNAPL